MTAETTNRPARWPRVVPRTVPVAAGILAATLLWIIVVPVAGHDLVIKDAGRPDIIIGPAAVITIATIASLAGWLLLTLLERITRQARRIWTALALTVMLSSFLPLATADTTLTTRITLALMHLLVAAAVFTAAFTPTRKRSQPRHPRPRPRRHH